MKKTKLSCAIRQMLGLAVTASLLPGAAYALQTAVTAESAVKTATAAQNADKTSEVQTTLHLGSCLFAQALTISGRREALVGKGKHAAAATHVVEVRGIVVGGYFCEMI